jgi:hypothetical protein
MSFSGGRKRSRKREKNNQIQKCRQGCIRMTIEVPRLSAQEIEASSTRLLRSTGWDTVSTGVIPVEGILEHHLKLSLDFDDLHTKLGIPMLGDEPEVLGALWVQSREVFIDQSLDPVENPSMEGRYRFTVAHEIGHWCLHREYIRTETIEDLFDQPISCKPTVVCRASRAKEPIEWQADTFASTLLMPAPLIWYWWRELYSRSGPLIFELFEHDSNWARPPLGWRNHTIGPPRAPIGRFDPVSVEYFFFRAASPLAPKFGVSVQAMQVRLERLGLLLLQRPSQSSAVGF